jgi:hypothetical protein
MTMVSLVWAEDPSLTNASTAHPPPSAQMTRSFRIIFSLLPQDLALRLKGPIAGSLIRIFIPDRIPQSVLFKPIL